MDGVWIAMWLALAINFWESSAITNKNNRGSKVQEEPVRNFRHVENPTVYSNSDWEVGLRESTNQALLRENYHAPNLRHRLLSAPLIGKHNTATPFGDIATVARGRLYVGPDGDFVFVQEPHQTGCHACRRHRRRCARCHEQVVNPHQDEQLVALWTVKRLRHRDYIDGYRYETEYTISPIGSLYGDAFAPESNPLEYPIPGHVFVVKHNVGTTKSVPPPVIYNQRAPQNHFRPEVLIGVGPDGKKHFLHSYPGFYTTSPVHPTYQSTNDPKEIELYKVLIEALAMKTSTTHKIEDGPHRFSLNNLYTTEDSFTPLVQLPTGEMVPLSSATSHVTDTPQPSTNPVLFTVPPVLQMVPAAPTEMSPMEVSRGKDCSESPASITTVHYFAAADEEQSPTGGEMEKSTSTDKPSTQHVDDGADFLFPLEMTSAAPKTTNTLYNPATPLAKGKTEAEIFPEQSAAPTRQSKLYHATFSAKKTSLAMPSTTPITSSTSNFTHTSEIVSSPEIMTQTTSSSEPMFRLETLKTTPTTIYTTTSTTTISPTTISIATPVITTSETTPTTTASQTTPTTISETTPTTSSFTQEIPRSSSPATLATTPIKPTANGISRTIKLPPPTNLILKSATPSKLDRPTTYRTKFTGPNASARFFPPTFKLITTKQNMEGGTTTTMPSTVVMTTPTTAISSTMPFTTELTTLTALSTKSTTTKSDTMIQTGTIPTISSPMSTGIDESGKKSTINSTMSMSTEKPTQEISMSTATSTQTSEFATTESTSIKTSTEEEDMEDMKFVLNPIPITPVKMSLVPESTVTNHIQTSMTNLQTTKDLTGTATSATEERKTTETMSTPDYTTFKTVMTSMAPTTEATSVMTEASTSTTIEETEKMIGLANTAGSVTTTEASSTTTEENTMLRMFNDFLSENTKETTVEGTTNASTVMTTEALSTTTEESTMVKIFNTFLDEYRMKKLVNNKPTKIDYSEDDIFGTFKDREKSTASTTVRATESQFAGELFGDRRRSPQTYPTDSSLTKPTKIIFSDFYEASTPPVTNKEELLTDDKPLTSQSYMTSISFKVNKKAKMVDEEVLQETATEATTESGMDDRETRKALNDAALQLVNHVRSINYLNGANSSAAQTKYKRRRTYVPKNRKVNMKRKI